METLAEIMHDPAFRRRDSVFAGLGTTDSAASPVGRRRQDVRAVDELDGPGREAIEEARNGNERNTRPDN
jgi:hypothetical protein